MSITWADENEEFGAKRVKNVNKKFKIVYEFLF